MPHASERAIKLAKEVLAKCMAYDPHFPKPSEAMILAWGEHISIRNPAREDMLDAVTRFYEHNTEGSKPLPAAISSIARQVRQDRMVRKEYEPPPDKSDDPPPPALPQSNRITLAQWEERHGEKFPRVRLGKSVPGAEVDEATAVNPLRVACPYCKSSPGAPCTTSVGVVLTKHRAHPSRMELAMANA